MLFLCKIKTMHAVKYTRNVYNLKWRLLFSVNANVYSPELLLPMFSECIYFSIMKRFKMQLYFMFMHENSTLYFPSFDNYRHVLNHIKVIISIVKIQNEFFRILTNTIQRPVHTKLFFVSMSPNTA